MSNLSNDGLRAALETIRDWPAKDGSILDGPKEVARAALSSHPAAVKEAEPPVFDLTAMYKAEELASLLAGSVGRNDVAQSEAYSSRLRAHLAQFVASTHRASADEAAAIRSDMGIPISTPVDASQEREALAQLILAAHNVIQAPGRHAGFMRTLEEKTVAAADAMRAALSSTPATVPHCRACDGESCNRPLCGHTAPQDVGVPEDTRRARLIADEAQKFADDRTHLGNLVYINDLVWALKILAATQNPPTATVQADREDAPTQDYQRGWRDGYQRRDDEVKGVLA